MTDIESGEETKKSRGGLLRFVWRATLALFVVGAFVVLGAGGLGYLAYRHVIDPTMGGEAVQFEIPQGSSGAIIGKLLADAGLVEHELFFRAAIRLEPNPETVQHGIYSVPRGMSPRQVLHVLYEGPLYPEGFDAFRLTVPEGLTILQTSELMADPEAFVAATRDDALRERLGVTLPDIEGLLMPDTYFFSETPSEAEIVKRMTDEFLARYGALMEEYPDAVEADRNFILTVASLVEEEARIDDERPIVASVIYNRLERGMPMEFDSTLQYALGKYGQRLLNEDKEVDSPYNTYRNKGLPPGPISNPSVASIRAALDPADTEFIFFVSNADGKSHTFSKTLREHNNAVARYRREIREQRRSEGNTGTP